MDHCEDGKKGKSEPICEKCHAGFKIVEEGSAKTCKECGNGTFGFDGVNCVNIPECSSSGNRNPFASCTKCSDGFYVKDGWCVESSVEGCAQYDDSGDCIKCSPGYGYDESSKKCNKCESDQYSDGSACTSYSAHKYCKVKSIEKDACLECNDGAVLFDGTCYSKIINWWL